MDATPQRVEIGPQKGPQYAFLSTPADIALFGGAAGGGKSFALLLEALRSTHRPAYEALIFRQSSVQVRQPGGLWSKSMELYPHCAAIPHSQALLWRFPSGAKVRFSYLDHPSDKIKFMGSEIAMLGFDELTHFDEDTFWFMLSRLRTMCGIKPYVRATCNPDADSWVAKLIAWWIDQETGYAIPERSGIVRWFARVGDDIHWGDDPRQLLNDYPECSPQSFTFIRSMLEDNRKLMESDPSYIHKLKNLQRVERERLLMGNWKIKPAAGNFFRKDWFEIVEAPPEASIVSRCRFWDRAATKVESKSKRKPDWTAGLLLAKDSKGIYYVEDIRRFQESPHNVEQAMLNTASQDPAGTIIAYHQDPGSAGVGEAQSTARALAGYNVKFEPATGDKGTRAKPASSQSEAKNIKIVRGQWNDAFITELENFPEGANDDQVDAFSGAFNILAQRGTGGQFERVERKDRVERTPRGQPLF
jgi:predicted phage terminase large subunit-like protein